MTDYARRALSAGLILGAMLFFPFLQAANATYALADLSDLPMISEMLATFAPSESRQSIENQLSLTSRKLAETPVSKRASVLHELAQATAWGTPERATAYYLCAWYGVNYERSRDYLLNSLFWRERGHYRPNKRTPFLWREETVDVLYELYKHNHDFRLLHDLVTGFGDGAIGTMLIGMRFKALTIHPRGVLHVSRISPKGREFAVWGLTGPCFPDYWDQYETKRIRSTYIPYVRRVADDPNDPLQSTARTLLREASGKN